MSDSRRRRWINRRSQQGRFWPIVLVGTAIVVVLLAIVTVVTVLRSTSDKHHGPSSAASASTPAASFAPERGGTIVEGDVGVPATFNPLLATSQTERDAAKLMFDGLVRVDGSGKPQPDLAKSWNINTDGLTYTVTLRPGITWQDGAPFTSQDVRYTLGLVQSPDFSEDPQLSQFWRPIVVDTPNDSTVVFHLMAPFSPFLNYLNLPILPKHLLGGVTAADLAVDPFNLSPIGTGPFKFVAYDQSTHELKLAEFEGYVNGRPNLDGITVRYFSDANSLITALKSGDVQASGTLSADQLLRADALPKADSVYAPELMSYTALFFNTRLEPFSSQIVRQALALAIDPSQLIDGPMKSQAIAGSSPIPSSSWAFDNQPVTYDQQRAISMLSSAGWTYAARDSVLENGDDKLSFQLLVNADDSNRVLMAQTIAQQLGKIHVHVDVKETTSDVVDQALASNQFSTAIFGGHYDDGDPDSLNVWGSADASSGLNVTGISDQAIDSALTDARTTTDMDKRQQHYAQFQQEFVKQAPAVVLYYPRYLFVVSSSVHGVTPDPIIDASDRFQHVSTWFMTGGSKSPTP